MATITTADVRRFLRDYPEWNILLEAYEFSDEDIDAAKRFAVSEFNVMTPVSSFTVDDFPQDWLLLLGTSAHLLRSESFLQVRNEVSYGDGNIAPVGVDSKVSAYVQLANNIKSEWKEVAQKYKQQMNMESGYGSLSSGYRYIRTGTRSG